MSAKLIQGAALGSLTVICWSSYNVAAKYGIDHGISAEALALFRFGVPGLIALPLAVCWLARGAKLPFPLWQLIVLVCLGGPMFGVLAVTGYRYAPLSHGLLIAPVAVFVSSTVLARVTLGDAVTVPRLAGALVMFVGLNLVVGFQAADEVQNVWLGALYFGAAGTMWGTYTVLLKAWRVPQYAGTFFIAAGSGLAAFVLLVPTTAIEIANLPARTLAFQAVMQGVVGGVLSVFALVGAIRFLRATTAALLPTFTPAVALFIAAVAFGAVPTVTELIGVIAIGLGFAVSLWPLERRSDGMSGWRRTDADSPARLLQKPAPRHG